MPVGEVGTFLLDNQCKHFKRNGKEPKPSNLLMSLRGQRMKAIKNMNQLNFVTEGMSSEHNDI